MYPLIKPKKNSYSLMQDFQEEMNRMLDEAFGETRLVETDAGLRRMWRPAIEMSEKDNQYLIKAELPGLERENIDIEISENDITIKGETSHKSEEKTDNIYKSEFKYGKFQRTITFPSEVDSENAHAEYKNGILKVVVPISEEEHKKHKKIEIEE